jgi:hypothetical protein
MGHKSIKTTMRYVHVKPYAIAATMAGVDFSGMLAGPEGGSRSSQLPVNQNGGRSESAA